MTRKKGPHGFVWRGDDDGTHEATVLLPENLRERFTATAQIVRQPNRPTEVRAITFRDTETGTAAHVVDGAVTLTFGESQSADQIGKFWSAARVGIDAARNLGGRPPGSRNKKRDALVDEVRANPTMTRAEIHRRGVEAGIWTQPNGDDDLIGSRVQRIRDDAGIPRKRSKRTNPRINP